MPYHFDIDWTIDRDPYSEKWSDPADLVAHAGRSLADAFGAKAVRIEDWHCADPQDERFRIRLAVSIDLAADSGCVRLLDPARDLPGFLQTTLTPGLFFAQSPSARVSPHIRDAA